MDNLHLILSIIISLLSGGLIPFVIKLYRDKKRLKLQAEIDQDLAINKVDKKVEKVDKKVEGLIDFFWIYIKNNGSDPKIKKIIKAKVKELKNG